MAADLVLAEACLGCGHPRGPLCPGCAGPLRGEAHPTRPTPCPAGFPPTWTVTGYCGPARSAIVAHKEHGRRGLLPLLAGAAARSVLAARVAPPQGWAAGRVLLVPVPATPGSRRVRGADPLGEIATRVAGRTGLTVCQPLRHVRRVADQSGLDSAGRAANLRTALAADPRLVAGAAVLLLDDIVTTGATLTEAARALLAAGASGVRAAVIAATARRGSSGPQGRVGSGGASIAHGMAGLGPPARHPGGGGRGDGLAQPASGG